MKNNNEKDKISKGGFNFTFSYTNEKTYSKYVEECLENVNIEDLIDVQVDMRSMEKDYKSSAGGFNFTFTHTGNKTYEDYIRECLKTKSVDELKDGVRRALESETIE